jgi:hypothetical protein
MENDKPAYIPVMYSNKMEELWNKFITDTEELKSQVVNVPAGERYQKTFFIQNENRYYKALVGQLLMKFPEVKIGHGISKLEQAQSIDSVVLNEKL